MLIKCTMREGITEADVEGYRYTFRPDKEGNPICSVTKESHIKIFLNMGSRCYEAFNPPKPVEQMSAKEFLSQPDGVYEEEKRRIRFEIAEAERTEAIKKAEAEKKDPEARLKKLEEKVGIRGKEDPILDKPLVITQSAAAALAEKKIAEITNSFKTLSKKRFRGWLDANHDQIATMPEDVKFELAKKFIKNWPEMDPEIPGLDLEKYGKPSENTANKGHSNNKP